MEKKEDETMLKNTNGDKFSDSSEPPETKTNEGTKRASFPPWRFVNESRGSNNEFLYPQFPISHYGNSELTEHDKDILPWDTFSETGQTFSSKNEELSIEKLSEQSSAFERFVSSQNIGPDKPFPEWRESSFPVNIFPVQEKNGEKGKNEHVWSGAKPKNLSLRNCRTPSPYMFQSKQTHSLPFNVGNPIDRRTTFPPAKSDDKHFPIQSNLKHPVDLLVTNLDQNVNPMEIKKNLLLLFGEHVMVLHISIFTLSDGNFAASVKVPSPHEAQYAISRLHRRKVGYKKIMISYAHSSNAQNPQFIRWQIINLLREVPHNKLPLFTFLELYESRYLTTVSVSELYKLKDICTITDENGRMVSLNSEYRNTPTPNPSLPYPENVELYCMRHFKSDFSGKGWAEQEITPLPNVIIGLEMFSKNISKLLESHNNILPLASFVQCYEAEIEKLNENDAGVPLEHLVTCVPNIKLSILNSVKYIEPSPPNTEENSNEFSKNVCPKLASVLNVFSRELVDFLKTQPHSQVTFGRFIPAYHHYFGRQCRVADYGFTRLIDLLEALPNIVQVMGEGNRKIVTLSHKTQMRRFTSDLLRVLKFQPTRKILVSELPSAFTATLSRPFNPVDYGLCKLEDLMSQISESIIIREPVGNDVAIYIPKREQTTQEVERTKVFANEVIELLSHAPQCSIIFNKFIPAYHHHFGHQCRMMDFGFTKLIELFESIPDIVKIEEDSKGERKVTLTQDQKRKVLSEQISGLVTPHYPPGLPIDLLSEGYIWKYGYALKTETYQASTLEELILNLPSVNVVDSEDGKIVVPVKEALIKHLTTRVMKILILSSDGKLSHSKLLSHFDSFHHENLKTSSLLTHIPEIVMVKDEKEKLVELTPLFQFARKLYKLLIERDGRLLLWMLESTYLKAFKTQLNPTQYGFPNIQGLLLAIPQVISLRGKGVKRLIILNRELLSHKTKLYLNVATADSYRNNHLSEIEDSKFSVPSPMFHEDPMIVLPDMPVPHVDMSMLSVYSPCKNLWTPFSWPNAPDGEKFLHPRHADRPKSMELMPFKNEVEDVSSIKKDAPEKSVKPDVSTISFLNVPNFNEDEFDAVGRNVAAKLRAMTKLQQTIAERLISEILFFGKMDRLSEETEINVEEGEMVSESNTGSDNREAVSL